MTHPFVKTFHDLLRDEQICTLDKMLLAALRFHQGSNGDCWPSIPTLTKEIGAKDERTTYRAMKRLKEMGLVKIIGSIGKSNHYELLTPDTNDTPDLKCSDIPVTPDKKAPAFESETPDKNGGLKERKEKNKKNTDTPSTESSKIYDEYIRRRSEAISKPGWLPSATKAIQMRANIKKMLTNSTVDEILSWLEGFFEDDYAGIKNYPWGLFAADPIAYAKKTTQIPSPQPEDPTWFEIRKLRAYDFQCLRQEAIPYARKQSQCGDKRDPPEDITRAYMIKLYKAGKDVVAQPP